MVTPGSVSSILLNGIDALNFRTGEDLLDWDKLALESLAGHADGFGKTLQILLVVARAGVEVVVSDLGRLKRVAADELDGAGAVARVSLEDGPGVHAVVGSDIVGVVGVVATEVDGSCQW